VRNTYSVLVGKPEGKKPVGTLRLGADGRKILGGKVWIGVNRIHLAQNRGLLDSVMKLRVP
jgi:hypothetical protein